MEKSITLITIGDSGNISPEKFSDLIKNMYPDDILYEPNPFTVVITTADSTEDVMGKIEASSPGDTKSRELLVVKTAAMYSADMTGKGRRLGNYITTGQRDVDLDKWKNKRDSKG